MNQVYFYTWVYECVVYVLWFYCSNKTFGHLDVESIYLVNLLSYYYILSNQQFENLYFAVFPNTEISIFSHWNSKKSLCFQLHERKILSWINKFVRNQCDRNFYSNKASVNVKNKSKWSNVRTNKQIDKRNLKAKNTVFFVSFRCVRVSNWF